MTEGQGRDRSLVVSLLAARLVHDTTDHAGSRISCWRVEDLAGRTRKFGTDRQRVFALTNSPFSSSPQHQLIQLPFCTRWVYLA